ncbi:hypothetical protein E4U41_003698 [Claviceps citrina]|nr:hypothetical protein E4U41_003698 [Claviceps citrina]
MAPSTIDLLVVTFNCAKSFVHVGVFANHMHTAFANNATGLPDIVVLSLQEIAPLSPSFIGDYFLNPYFTRFEEAINVAAKRQGSQHGPWSRAAGAAEDGSEASVSDTSGSPDSDLNSASDSDPDPERRRKRRRRRQRQDKPEQTFTLVKAHNAGYTAILLFAKDSQSIRKLQDAEVSFGTAEMGSKGAVGLRMLYDVKGDGKQATELTFVAAHFAAMEWNLPQRNANWAATMKGLIFGDPEATRDLPRGLAGTPAPPTPADSDDRRDEDDEEQRLLHETDRREQVQVQQRLHNMSVFKPSSHLFVAGDLNYRISTSPPPPEAAFPSLDPSSESYYPAFLPLDQLTHERAAGRTMHGLSEANVQFPPTYKYKVLPKETPVDDEDEGQVPWKFASHRYPGWTDRVLYLDVPPWVQPEPRSEPPPSIDILAYDALPVIRSSDHRPVYLRAQVPIILPEDMRPPEEEQHDTWSDPRAKLPVEVDPEAWARRRAARRKELVVGWGAFLWTTEEGAWVLAALLAAGVGAWWFSRMG